MYRALQNVTQPYVTAVWPADTHIWIHVRCLSSIPIASHASNYTEARVPKELHTKDTSKLCIMIKETPFEHHTLNKPVL